MWYLLHFLHSSTIHLLFKFATLLQINQPTMSRRRRIGGIDRLNVYRVNANGRLEDLGILHSVASAGFVLEYADVQHAARWYRGLPWSMIDMRPQGFIGRAFTRQHASTLGLPPDPRH
jgi:hypothetical protein